MGRGGGAETVVEVKKVVVVVESVKVDEEMGVV